MNNRRWQSWYGIVPVIFLFLGSISPAFAGYTIQDKKVYFTEANYGPVELESADAGTFVVLKYNGKPTYFAKDKSHAYHFGVDLPNADAQSFEAINESYAKDLKNIFYQIWVVSGADQDSFVGLSRFYGKDKNFAYRLNRKFVVKDVATFDTARDLYSKDTNSYYSNNELYSRDKFGFYFNDGGIIIGTSKKDVDNGTIEALGTENIADFRIVNEAGEKYHFGYWATDGKNFYCRGVRVPVGDIATFTILNSFYSKDKDSVFFIGTIVDGADASSFSILKDRDASIGYDKNHKFVREKIKEW